MPWNTAASKPLKSFSSLRKEPPLGYAPGLLSFSDQVAPLSSVTVNRGAPSSLSMTKLLSTVHVVGAAVGAI